jgi:3-hydroxybutyryl-CoA dehydrogenase
VEAVGVVGAGTMGAGIAQVAAAAGHPVLLYDAVPGAAERAADGVRERLAALVAKGRLDAATAAAARLDPVGDLAGLAAARVVVEAVVEDLAVKRAVFADLERVVAADCVLATNTSSLSPTAIAAGLAHPERLVGMHFFNPVPVMRLVEVVPGLATAAAVADEVAALATAWGKTVVRSTATPGFVVNRVARPFYAEAWRLYEERAAEPAVIDAVLTGAGGFRLGPFGVMDLIGQDINQAVTRSVWAAFGHDPRYTPSLAQAELVEAGWLGRKTGRGVYRHDGVAEPEPAPLPDRDAPAGIAGGGPDWAALLDRAGLPVTAGDPTLPGGAMLLRCDGTPATLLAARHGVPVVVVDRTIDDTAARAVALAASDGCPEPVVDAATGLLQRAGLAVYRLDDTPGLAVTRTVAALVNAAADALQHGVASAADIDTGMRLGTGYPLGSLEWGDRWGATLVLTVLDNLHAVYADPRYRASPLLRRHAASGQPLAG